MVGWSLTSLFSTNTARPISETSLQIGFSCLPTNSDNAGYQLGQLAVSWSSCWVQRRADIIIYVYTSMAGCGYGTQPMSGLGARYFVVSSALL